MFGSCHYVPVLRWKQAERLALSYLDDVDKEGMTLLLDFRPSSPILVAFRQSAAPTTPSRRSRLPRDSMD